MNLLEDLTMLLINFNFVMIYIIHKMLVFLKNLKDSISECFIYLDFYLFIFLQHIVMESVSLEKENMIKDIKNLLD